MRTDITIVKNIRDDAALRGSFNSLAEKTFGLNFENWYQNGYWKDNYIPYAAILEGQVIAIEYDETAQAPYFYYTDSQGVQHAVWFEDARSLSAKLRLLAEFRLFGAGFWNLMRPFPQGWVTLESLFQIR